MKVKMFLAEAATTHPDGTVSMLRAGITHVWGDSEPYGLQGALVVRIEAELSESGQHRFEVMCRDEDGRDVMPKIEGQFAVPTGGGHNHLILNMGMGFPHAARYVFAVTVDGHEQDRWVLNVGPRGKQQETQP